jgi:hypothetical protein
MTLTEIQTFVKARYKESTTELDSLITALANEAMVYFCRKARFPQMEVLGATFTTTAGTEAYATSSNFDRLIGDSVRYDVTTSDNGTILPVANDSELEYYRALDRCSQPLACAIGAPTSGTSFRVLLYPPFTETAKVVAYDYMKQPTALSAGSNSLEVPALDYAVCYYCLKGLAEYHDDDKGAASRADRYGREMRNHWLNATKTVTAGF